MVELQSDQAQEFMGAYPGMALQPPQGRMTVFEGEFRFSASWQDVRLEDGYQLRIYVPPYPESLPIVLETGGRIKRAADEHVYANGELCLGSELRLRMIIGAKLNLLKFADECLVPYLYATTRRVAEGRFVFGELAHGAVGTISDYKDLFGVRDEAAVFGTLRILAAKPSSADRHPCPCGCGRRLIQCSFRERVSEFRKLAHRKRFRSMYDDAGKGKM